MDPHRNSDIWIGANHRFGAGYRPAISGTENPVKVVAFYAGQASAGIHERLRNLTGWTCVALGADLANTIASNFYMLRMVETDAHGNSTVSIVGGRSPTTFSVDKIGTLAPRPFVPVQVTQAVRHLAEELCRIVAEDPSALGEMEWRDVERVVAGSLRDIGFSVVLTPPSKDGGKDIIARCQIVGDEQTFYIEVKHWMEKRVGVQDVTKFVQVNVRDRTHGGLFLSTSGYSGAVYEHRSEITRDVVRLADSRSLVALARHAIRARDGIWSRQALPETLFAHSIDQS